MEKVKVWVSVAGNYCAFHEMCFSVDYDITNDIQLEDWTIEELENMEKDSYCDYEVRNAIKVGGTYYVEW